MCDPKYHQFLNITAVNHTQVPNIGYHHMPDFLGVVLSISIYLVSIGTSGFFITKLFFLKALSSTVQKIVYWGGD